MKYQSTHTKPGFSKANKSLTVSEYTTLLGLAAEARKLVGAKYDRLSVGHVRVFTEPRKGGLRTKLWGSGTVKPQQVKDIQDMLTKRFPQLNVEVHYNAEKQCRWYLDALSIFLRVKPNTWPISEYEVAAKPAPVAEKPKVRLSGSPLIMQSAVVDVATIPAGTLSIETQMHIAVGSKTKTLEFELVDSWLLLNGEYIMHSDSDPYNNYLVLHLGRSKDQIYKDAESAAEEVMRKSMVFRDGKLIIG